MPVSQNDSVQTLAGFVFGNCNYGSDYGKLTVFETPAGESIDGPALIDARILSNPTVSQKITLLNSGGSSRGPRQPSRRARGRIDPLLPSSLCPGEELVPGLQEVIARVRRAGRAARSTWQPTLTQALSDIFGTASTTPTTPSKRIAASV